jgi:RND family efflux transporter MFP subunit
MKKIIFIGIGIAIIGLMAFVLIDNKTKNQQAASLVGKRNATVAVRIDTVKTMMPDLSYEADGIFIPMQELSFPAENTGRVMKVMVDEGSEVRIGQTLAIIKGDQLSVELQNSQAAYQNAATNFNRYTSAFSTGGVTRQQLDQSKLDLANAKAKLDQSRINFGDATIKSTINGIVNKRNIEPGSVVSPGFELFEIVNVSTLKLRVNVTESQISGLKLNTVVSVKASTFPDKDFRGKITFIAPKADSSLNFAVEIEIINNREKDLKAGMYGSAIVALSNGQKQIKAIPRSAFISGVASNEIYVVDNSTASLRKIVSGRIIGDNVEVLEGLDEGDLVITSGQINVTSGSKVSAIQ